MNEKTESNLTDNFSCHKCGEPGFKSDGESKVWCEKCLKKAMYGPPIVRIERPGRNEHCWCGSGKKYKKCCLITQNSIE